jgi:archaellum biogenesis ATPase FlaH
LIQALFEHTRNTPEDAWVYVAITRPYGTITNQFEDVLDSNNVRFIDCISRAAGITKVDSNCIFIESPTMLEKLGLEIINLFKNVEEDTEKYLLIDSLSSLIVYNDPEIVTEFFYHLVNKTRARNIHTISLAIEEEGLDKYFNKLIYLNDKILKVRDSFI